MKYFIPGGTIFRSNEELQKREGYDGYLDLADIFADEKSLNPKMIKELRTNYKFMKIVQD